MTISLYDTASRSVREFTPLRPGEVSVYLCGATVQAPPHIGHIRSGVAFDVMSRWFAYNGYDVTLVRNVTDIDDKILAGADAEGVPFWRLAMRNERAFSWAYDVLGCLPPAAEPRATGHVPEMIVLMRRLIDSGHAYAADGDVYFDVKSYPEYGALSGQRVDEMQAAPDSTSEAKRDPRDFALWKSTKPGEPSWDTPWGPGRPGWHLECSAMAHRYLGPAFDIHGGGLDLIFPHHENEIAQSKAAGDPFASYWLHNYWVTTSGEKMSKSLGNSLLVSEVVQRVRPIELRYYLTAAHYRSHIEFSEEAMHEAAAGFRRIESFLRRAMPAIGSDWASTTTAPPAFADAMNDDFGVPAALAVVHETVREGNAAIDRGDIEALKEAFAAVMGMTEVLGLNPLLPPWDDHGADRARVKALRDAVDALVSAQLEARAQARAAKDFATADAIRDSLTAAGIVIEDTPEGARWSLAQEQ
ncbi:MAG TPA: cysteine--tRNA ligase [Actinomycetes bacterium]|nr:cysteine--tRNA ligase [Actinomycetes bacterium]